MATGLTKKVWSDSTNIIGTENYCGDTSYELHYKGKSPREEVLSEECCCTYKHVWGLGSNRLFYGDNLDVLRELLQLSEMRGAVKLIYIDPPYGTNSIFQSRNLKDSYKDDIVGSHYLEFLRRRLILMYELLSEDGSIYLHLDNNMTPQVKIIMDEIFGAKNFRALITRKKCSNKNFTKSTYGNISDYILFYSKSNNYLWNRATMSWSDEKLKKEYPSIDQQTGRRYKKVPIHAPGIRNGETGLSWRGMMPPKGKHWQYTPTRLDQMDAAGEIYWSASGNPRRKVFLEQEKGVAVQDIWLDVPDSINQNIKITGYPTEKNPELLKRIIEASSNPGDLVLDCFMGSGTTLGVAQQLGRRWIGVDNSLEAMKCTLKRFFVGVERMGNHAEVQSCDQAKNSSPSNTETKISVDFELIANESFHSEICSTIQAFLHSEQIHEQ